MSGEIALSRAEIKAEFKENYHDAIRANMPPLLKDYLQILKTTDDPEIIRKGLVYFSQVVGVDAEKKVDPTSTLPTIHISIGRGAVPSTVEVAGQVIDVTDVVTLQRRQDAIDAFKPSQSMRDMAHINDTMFDGDDE